MAWVGAQVGPDHWDWQHDCTVLRRGFETRDNIAPKPQQKWRGGLGLGGVCDRASRLPSAHFMRSTAAPMHDVAATAADIAARGPRLLDAPDRPARQGKARQGKARLPDRCKQPRRFVICSARGITLWRATPRRTSPPARALAHAPQSATARCALSGCTVCAYCARLLDHRARPLHTSYDRDEP